MTRIKQPNSAAFVQPSQEPAIAGAARHLESRELDTQDVLLESSRYRGDNAPRDVLSLPTYSNAAEHIQAAAAAPPAFEQALDEAEGPEQALHILQRAAGCGQLASIKSMDLASFGLQKSHLQRLCDIYSRDESAKDIAPTALILKLNTLGRETGNILASWPHSRNLREIDLGSTGLGDEGVAQLASGSYPCLKTLRLWSNNLTSASATSLIDSKLMQSLETLSLADNDLGDEGAICLTRRVWPELIKLDIQWNGLSHTGARALGDHRQPARVEIYENTISHAQSRDLAACYPQLILPRISS